MLYYVIQFHVTPTYAMLCQLMLHHDKNYHTLFCGTMYCNAKPCHVPAYAMIFHAKKSNAILCDTMSYYAMPAYTMLCQPMLYHFKNYRALICGTMYWNAKPCHVLANAMPC